MKKLILIILAVVSLLLVGCNEEKIPNPIKLNILTSTTKIEIMKDYDKESDVQYQDKIVITNLNELKIIIEDLNSLELIECDLDNYEYKKTQYFIVCGSKKIFITDEKTIYVQENGNKKYSIQEGKIEFLNSYFINRKYHFSDYSFNGEIVIKKVDISKETIVSDGQMFYEKLNTITFVKATTNISNYEFIIKIGNETIQVAKQYFCFQNQMYEVIEGNFDFLNDYNFNNSGWLPWV